MPTTDAGRFADALAATGVKRVRGIVGDNLNGIADSMRRQGKIEWLHVRREGPVPVNAVASHSELAMPLLRHVGEGERFQAGGDERPRRRGDRPRPFQSVPLRRMVMEIRAVRASPLRLPPSIGGTSASIVQLATENTRLSEFFALMKPRVMLLAVFTALVGFLTAPTHPDPLFGFIALLAIAMGAGAAGVLNMWYDADIDRVMSRTATRPIPRGAVSRGEAQVFGLALGAGSVAVLALAANLAAAGLLAFTIVFYVVVYTVWLKRRTPQNIVIGGAAGALPPVIGWAAATGDIGIEPLILFLIVFLWTPPHFWALAVNRRDEYARAGIPMLPVVAGRAATTQQILIYSILLVPVALLPWVLGFAGPIYGATSAICGAIFVVLAYRLRRSRSSNRRAANRLFAFSIFYLFALFAALLAGNNGNRSSPTLSPRAALTGTASVAGEFLPCAMRSARSLDGMSAGGA